MSMPDTALQPLGSIQWPQGIDESIFLEQYWQKKPLLIRQAFPGFDTPLPPDELAGLSLEPDTNGRIITQNDNGTYALEHGPFNENRFASLTDNRWSLLVTDVEKHIPEFIVYLQPFRFIPDWRIDDLMISYAPEGASVGAHVDEYDVFLLQGSGVRTWSIDARTDAAHQMRCDGDLKILADFSATDTWDLIPGDMLYLPPNMAHHGIAKGDDCTTWSIGFRAPRLSDFIARVADMLSETMPPARYTDGPLSPSRHGEISMASVQRFKAVWDTATQLDDHAFAQLLGRWLTESSELSPATHQKTDTGETDDNTQSIDYQKAPFCRFAWMEHSAHTATLFADGSALSCSLEFAQRVCYSQQWVSLEPVSLSDTDSAALQLLVSMGCLLR